MRTLVTVLLAVTLALSGCTLLTGNKPTPTPSTTAPPPETTTPEVTTTPVTTTPSTTTTTTPPTPTGIASSEYALSLGGVPPLIESGVAFNFTLFANGTTQRTSDNIGALYGAATTSDPTTTAYQNACVTRSGTVPGSFLVNCTITKAGDAFLRGHFVAGGTDFWSPEAKIVVRAPVGAFTVTSPNATGAAPAGTNDPELIPPAQAGQPYTLVLNVTGTGTESASNITLRVGASSQVGEIGSSTSIACNHQTGTLPGEFTVTCNFPSSGLTTATYTVYGHVEVVVGPIVHKFESPGYTLRVLPASPV
ncbi:MAG: hypothetical protein WDA16_05565 [Candidatus Thermoplasmatota archaeon]